MRPCHGAASPDENVELVLDVVAEVSLRLGGVPLASDEYHGGPSGGVVRRPVALATAKSGRLQHPADGNRAQPARRRAARPLLTLRRACARREARRVSRRRRHPALLLLSLTCRHVSFALAPEINARPANVSPSNQRLDEGHCREEGENDLSSERKSSYLACKAQQCSRLYIGVVRHGVMWPCDARRAARYFSAARAGATVMMRASP